MYAILKGSGAHRDRFSASFEKPEGGGCINSLHWRELSPERASSVSLKPSWELQSKTRGENLLTALITTAGAPDVGERFA